MASADYAYQDPEQANAYGPPIDTRLPLREGAIDMLAIQRGRADAYLPKDAGEKGK